MITELDVLSRPLWNAACSLDATAPRPYTDLAEHATITVSTRPTDNGEWRERRRYPGAAVQVRAAAYGLEPGTTVRVAVLDEAGRAADAFTCAPSERPVRQPTGSDQGGSRGVRTAKSVSTSPMADRVGRRRRVGRVAGTAAGPCGGGRGVSRRRPRAARTASIVRRTR
ncbi:MAG: hypothetical protein ABIQ18_09980 [Umezawaea sp.]